MGLTPTVGLIPPIALTDTGTELRCAAGDTEIFRYVYRPSMPADHAPRPYLHPVRTLGGVELTEVTPADHPWHYGISLAVPMIAKSSFWGGPTYLTGRGYVPLANHGRVEHQDWLEQRVDAGTVTLRQRLTWWDHRDRAVIDEQRTLRAALDGAAWTLAWDSRLRNVAPDPLSLQSPATAGRASAGYGGLFVRAAAEFLDGQVVDSDGHIGDAAFGQRSRSLTMYTHRASITVTADDIAREPWFTRHEEYPGICAALAFHRPLTVSPGDLLARTYRIRLRDLDTTR